MHEKEECTSISVLLLNKASNLSNKQNKKWVLKYPNPINYNSRSCPKKPWKDFIMKSNVNLI